MGLLLGRVPYTNNTCILYMTYQNTINHIGTSHQWFCISMDS